MALLDGIEGILAREIAEMIEQLTQSVYAGAANYTVNCRCAAEPATEDDVVEGQFVRLPDQKLIGGGS